MSESESGQDRPERDGGEGGAPGASPEHLALLADGVVELRKRGGTAARRTPPEDGRAPAGEADARDAHYAAGNEVPDPRLEAMARRAADRAGRPRA
ncbi:hypothetical protein [Streptomyces sp. H27-S2]|uniref:hypothetical protein n=1 Tax=Streptomyces antarcticus TaxID=2996458 RepID=UPI002270DC0B|nr:hypothetical protein [Streptomyces sp. H27-S2]MCY0952002.1 hypothetical protein [Streptomyces sp. H27-S2]